MVVLPTFIGDRDVEETIDLLNERQLMLKNGILQISLVFDVQQKKMLHKIQIISRGSFFVDKETNFNNRIVSQINDEVDRYLQLKSFNEKEILQKVENITSHLLYKEKKISPLIHVEILIKEK